RDVGAEARRLAAVYAHTPFDARNGPAVSHVHEPVDPSETFAKQRDRLGQPLRLPGRQLDLDRLAGRESRFLLFGLDDEPRDIGSARTDLLEDCCRRTALRPVDVAELD